METQFFRNITLLSISIFLYHIFSSIILFSIQYQAFSKKGSIVMSKYPEVNSDTFLHNSKIEKSSQSI